MSILWCVQLLLMVLKWAPCSAQCIAVTVPLTVPPSAPVLSRSFISFSLEQDRWADWVGQGSGNPFFFNTLNNLKDFTGEPPRIRIGADSEDRTIFDSSVQVWPCLSLWHRWEFSTITQLSTSEFPAISATVPYPEATENVVGTNFYRLASLLPNGDHLPSQSLWKGTLLNKCFRDSGHMGS